MNNLYIAQYCNVSCDQNCVQIMFPICAIGEVQFDYSALYNFVTLMSLTYLCRQTLKRWMESRRACFSHFTQQFTELEEEPQSTEWQLWNWKKCVMLSIQKSYLSSPIREAIFGACPQMHSKSFSFLLKPCTLFLSAKDRESWVI